MNKFDDREMSYLATLADLPEADKQKILLSDLPIPQSLATKLAKSKIKTVGDLARDRHRAYQLASTKKPIVEQLLASLRMSEQMEFQFVNTTDKKIEPKDIEWRLETREREALVETVKTLKALVERLEGVLS